MELEAGQLKYDEQNILKLEPAVEGCKGKPLTIRIDSGKTGVSFQYGKTVTAGKIEIQAKDTTGLTVQGEPLEGKMLVATRGRIRLGLSWLVWPLAALCYAGSAVLIGMVGNSIDKKVRIMR